MASFPNFHVQFDPNILNSMNHQPNPSYINQQSTSFPVNPQNNAGSFLQFPPPCNPVSPHVVSTFPDVRSGINSVVVPNINLLKSVPPPNVSPVPDNTIILQNNQFINRPLINSKSNHNQFSLSSSISQNFQFSPTNHFSATVQQPNSINTNYCPPLSLSINQFGTTIQNNLSSTQNTFHSISNPSFDNFKKPEGYGTSFNNKSINNNFTSPEKFSSKNFSTTSQIGQNSRNFYGDNLNNINSSSLNNLGTFSQTRQNSSNFYGNNFMIENMNSTSPRNFNTMSQTVRNSPGICGSNFKFENLNSISPRINSATSQTVQNSSRFYDNNFKPENMNSPNLRNLSTMSQTVQNSLGTFRSNFKFENLSSISPTINSATSQPIPNSSGFYGNHFETENLNSPNLRNFSIVPQTMQNSPQICAPHFSHDIRDSVSLRNFSLASQQNPSSCYSNNFNNKKRNFNSILQTVQNSSTFYGNNSNHENRNSFGFRSFSSISHSSVYKSPTKFNDNMKNRMSNKTSSFTNNITVKQEQSSSSFLGQSRCGKVWSSGYQSPRLQRFQQNKFNRNFQATSNTETNSNHFCDTCDRTFMTNDELKEHMSLHIKCNYKNCQFEAHPKVVALHKKMQHATGYADTINRLKNDEEIEKWRAERRRRYPTAENIRKRKEEQAEKEARGEVIENKDFGLFKKPNSERPFIKPQRHNKRRRNWNFPHSIEKSTVIEIDSGSDTDDDSHIKLPKFKGLNHDSEHSEIKCMSPESGNRLNDQTEGEIDLEELGNDSKTNKDSNPVGNVLNDEYDSDPIEIPVEINISSSDDDKAIPTSQEKTFLQNCSNNPVIEVDLIDTDESSPIKIPFKKNSVHSAKDGSNPIKISLQEKSFDTGDNKRHDVPVSMEISIIENSAVEDCIENDDAPVEIPIQKSLAIDDKCSFEVQSNSSDISPNKKRPIIDDKGKNTSTKRPRRNNRSFNKKNQGASIEEAKKSEDVCKQQESYPVRKTLLEKLLADDIRHERNVIMQCVRHIVRKNFFGIEENSC